MPRKVAAAASTASTATLSDRTQDDLANKLKRFRRESGAADENPVESSSAALTTAAAPAAPSAASPPSAAKRRKVQTAKSPSASASSTAASAASTPAASQTESETPSDPRFPPPQTPPGSPSKGYGKAIEPPTYWRDQLEAIKVMRAAKNAPVDSMGCERCCDTTASAAVQRYQTLVSLMLSSQTKDEITYAATKRLIAHGLTPENIAKTEQDVIAELIKPVGFWRLKAGYIKETTAMLLRDYGGDIPDSIEGLCGLKGVGPKMAFIAMSSAWNKPVGIGVDTHVHRISNRLRWVRTETPEATRTHLQTWLPREHWAEINVLLVGLGQTICTPINPKCEQCKCASICPASSYRPRGPGAGAVRSLGSMLEAANEGSSSSSAASTAAAPAANVSAKSLEW
jgi:endonuclease-3